MSYSLNNWLFLLFGGASPVVDVKAAVLLSLLLRDMAMS